MGTCSSAAHAVGARKRRQPPWEAHGDSWRQGLLAGAPPRTPRGLRPCDPAQTKTKPFSEGRTKAIPHPPVGRDGARCVRRKNEEKLARDTLGALKQHHVLGSASLA